MPLYDYWCPRCNCRSEVYLKIAELEDCRLLFCSNCWQDFARRQVTAPLVMGDYEGYTCPVTDRWIEGRAAHRENLKRQGCRLHEPGEKEEMLRRKKSEDQRFEAAVESTLDEAITKMPVRKRELLEQEGRAGVTAEVVRGTLGD